MQEKRKLTGGVKVMSDSQNTGGKVIRDRGGGSLKLLFTLLLNETDAADLIRSSGSLNYSELIPHYFTLKPA